MKLFTLTIALLLFQGADLILAQIQTIDIWQGNVPNSRPNDNYKLITDTTGTWSFMRHIINPKLDMYPAGENKSANSAVIICPGGAYWGLAFKHEGMEVAQWLNSLGITAFVLKYRLPDTAIMINKTIGPLQDAQEAIRIVRRNSEKWNIDPDKIGILGFSAGGHLASTLSTHYNDSVYESADTTSARPDFSVLIYPVISMENTLTHGGSRINLLGKNPDENLVKFYSNDQQVNEYTPPAFLVHSADDNTVPVENSINYILSLKKFSVPCELHIYQSGGHGYGLGQTDNTESDWPEACKRWLQSKGLL